LNLLEQNDLNLFSTLDDSNNESSFFAEVRIEQNLIVSEQSLDLTSFVDGDYIPIKFPKTIGRTII
jgi:hypothetical protein